MTYNDVRELARLLPDPVVDELSEHRHQMLREQFMHEIRQNRAERETPVRSRKTVLALAGGFVAVAMVVAATVALIGHSWPRSLGTTQPTVSTPPTLPMPTATITYDPPVHVGVQTPPPLEVRYGSTALVLVPHTFCSGLCVAGFDPDPPSVGSPDEIFVHVPLAEPRTLRVDQTVAGASADCMRSIEADVATMGGGWMRVRPRGPAGDYLVSFYVSGAGVQGMVATIRWRTPVDGPMTTGPFARLVVPVEASPTVGLQLVLGGVLVPLTATATATVTFMGSGGQSTAATLEAAPCQPLESLWLMAPGVNIAGLRAPLAVTVELVLDGVTYRATATWPWPGSYQALTFTPPLP
jgi:hypothetical protein